MYSALLAAAAAGALAFGAQARDLDPTLKQYVIVSCSEDAYRLCPQALGSEQDAVSCMKTKRNQLNQTCRAAYDKAIHVLAQ